MRTLSRGGLARALGLAVIAALIPLSAAAGEKVRSSDPRTLQPTTSSVAKVARELAPTQATQGSKMIASPAVRRAEQQGTTPATQSGSFFKTTAGIVVLSTLAVGVGYALYSTSHDRVSSPGKK